MTASAIPRSRWRTCHLFRAPRGIVCGHSWRNGLRQSAHRNFRGLRNLWHTGGAKKAGRCTNSTGVIHEGEIMDFSIVPDPDPTIQSCWDERRCALSGYPAPAGSEATIAAAAQSLIGPN